MKRTHKVKERYKRKFVTLGKNIRKVRESKGRTQEYVAFNSGVSFGSVNAIENGHINPTIGTLYAIAEALKVPLSDIIID
jgi:transcriptional regulator with XRE-family HTH domain